MTTSTLPRVAADLYGSGVPWYAARLVHDADPDARNVLWRPVPFLLDDSMRWATDAEVQSQHITLDAVTIAKLLCADSSIDPAAPLSDTAIRVVLDHELTACHCDVRVSEDQLAQEYGDHPETTQPRMAACLALAEQLLGGGA